MLIDLIRHGETAWNRAGRYQGRSDTSLSAAGRAALRRAEYDPPEVFVTTLRRTEETAGILFPTAARVAAAGLEEMDFGDFEGRTASEMAEDADYRRWVAGGCMGRCPHGESRGMFLRRICRAFAALTDRALDGGRDRLTIVAHGGTQMAVLSRYGRPKRQYYDWLTGYGKGFLLDAVHWKRDRVLYVAGRLDFTQKDQTEPEWRDRDPPRFPENRI